MTDRRLSEPMLLMLEAVLTDKYPVGRENTLRAILKHEPRLIEYVATDPVSRMQVWRLTDHGEQTLRLTDHGKQLLEWCGY